MSHPSNYDFRITTPSNMSIYGVYSMRSEILLDAEYQRESDIWNLEKRQYLIDSIINGFALPNLYLHEFYPAKLVNGKRYKYAVIDGKQRLLAIWKFMEDGYRLLPSFSLLKDPTANLGGMTYTELANQHPHWKNFFDSVTLPIVTIQSENEEIIEDMFSRMNDAMPLNAPEKRNAFGGPMPMAIKAIAKSQFVVGKIRIAASRYRHLDLAAKLLYLEFRGDISSTKKNVLDDFVKSFKIRNKGKEDADKLVQRVKATLVLMDKVFKKDDPLLKSAGMVILYYWLMREHGARYRIDRSILLKFEELRKKNREAAASDMADSKFELLEFDRLAQTPNDEYAIRQRYDLLVQYIKDNT